MNHAALEDFPTERLLDELERRSLGCVCVFVRIEAGRDIWESRVRGSTVLLGALSAVASLKTSKYIQDAEGKDAEE